MFTQINTECANLIKSFEGFRSTAYYDSVGVLTIGYGTTNLVSKATGVTVTKGMTCTEAQATEWLMKAVNYKFVPCVNKYDNVYRWNENQFSALVSFAYNIGSIDQLVNYGKRTIEEISAKIPAYCKAGGRTLAGLSRRRAVEKALFDRAVTQATTSRTVFYGTVNAKSGLRCRTTPMTGLATYVFANNTKLIATDYQDGWFYVTDGTHKGWCSGSYLSWNTGIITASTLNARQTPKTGTVLFTIPKGQNVSIIAQDDSLWYWILYQGKTAWVSPDYVTLT